MMPLWLATLILVALWSWSAVVIVASLDRIHDKLAEIEALLRGVDAANDNEA